LPRGITATSREGSSNPDSSGVGIFETDTAWIIQTDLPGFCKEDVYLSFHKGNLRLAAERKNPAHAFQSRIERSFQVTKELDEANISATLENGLLEITLPKPTTEISGPVEITVN
jgi:HSP20 family protein